MLFQIDLSKSDPEWVIREFWNANKAAEPVKEYAERLVRGVCQHLASIDQMLVEVAENWRLDRMAAVDRNVLRLAIYELLHAPETPAKVVINEAIEIAKKFGSDQSGTFVNGVLDGARRGLEAARSAT